MQTTKYTWKHFKRRRRDFWRLLMSQQERERNFTFVNGEIGVAKQYKTP